MVGISDPPLAGTRILSVEQYGAGPFASMYLADMGAEVIKIESPATGGDSSRASGPHFLGDGDSHFFQTFNLGKKSLDLDLRAPRGKEVLHRLVGTADVVMNNLRGDLPGKLGLTYADLSPHNPRVVCTHLSGYGRVGERATWPSYDYLMQAEAGYLSLTGEPDGPMTRMGLSIVDYITGITTAFALTAALVGALRTGKGRDVDVTLYDVAMHQLTYPATWYLNEGDVVARRPRSGHPSVVPCETYPTADGHIFVMCVLPKFWIQLCQILGLPDLPEDPRFATPRDRFDNRDALAALLDAAFGQQSTAHWMGKLAGRVPAAPVLTMPEALDNPYFARTEGIQSIDHPDRPGLRVLSSPIRLDGERARATPAPKRGADTDAVLRSAGFLDDDIAALRAEKVI
ncbi:CaiB/BaiF CoA transferase family protein [Flavimaricola marinus]|uniref:Formyl-coenzyme A transferase n=1 Tax=Flavimaricola marinus TaxID=1819565 RepID=A0A238LEQ4_9RHOB|nr:CoA transferase [Flavimaricola marinus]SMY08159.1 Formyl-coenzyme A transferase [Flavimaricola marinus]